MWIVDEGDLGEGFIWFDLTQLVVECIRAMLLLLYLHITVTNLHGLGINFG